MSFSPVGRKQLAAHTFLLFVTIVVLALAARVNQFQEFFFAADIFPLVLSIVTLVLVVALNTIDLVRDDAYTARPQFTAGLLGALSVLWLAANAFSTSRWRHVPLACGTIPADFPDARTWCRDLQALKAFVWAEWLLLLGIAAATLRFALTQRARGAAHVFRGPLSRFTRAGRSSEFLQFENEKY